MTRTELQEIIDREFDSFIDFPGDLRKAVTATSCKLFAEHVVGVIQTRPAVQMDVAGLLEALEWYAEKVKECRKIGSAGDTARQELDLDGGVRALHALAAHRSRKENDMSETELINQIIADSNAMSKAGDGLAAAALRVTTEYDGVHRLRLAVSKWAKVRADEGGRAEQPRPAVPDEWVYVDERLPPTSTNEKDNLLLTLQSVQSGNRIVRTGCRVKADDADWHSDGFEISNVWDVIAWKELDQPAAQQPEGVKQYLTAQNR